MDSIATDYIISINKDSYLPAFYHSNGTVYKISEAEKLAASDSYFDIIMKNGFKILGKVLFNDTPVSGIRIEAWAEDIQCWASTTSVDSTDNKNNFIVKGLLAGTYVLTLKSDIYSQKTVDNIGIENDDIDNIIIKLEKFERSISGKVYGLDSGKTVRIYAWSESIKSGDNISLAGNGNDLAFMISGLKPSYDYKVQLMSSNYPNQYYKDHTNWNDSDIVDLRTNDAPNIDFYLDIETVVISGTVTFPTNAVPGDDVWIDALSSSSYILKNAVRLVYTAAHSLPYSISGIEKDTYILYAHSDKFKRTYYHNTFKLQSAQIIDTRNTVWVENIHFTLSTGAVVSGIVTDADGNGTSGIRVEAFSDATSSGGSSNTLDTGEYSIAGLESAEDFKVSANKQGLAPFYYHSDGTVRNRTDASLINTILSTEHDQINISLSEGQSISGTVNTLDSKPVAGVWGTASSVTHKIENSERTNADGFYEISGLTPGYDYKLTVKPPCSSSLVPDEKTNISTNTGRINFYLSQGSEISGYITAGRTGKPIAQVKVSVLSSASNYFCSSTSDLSGQYHITGLPNSDDYVVSAHPPVEANYQEGVIDKLTIDQDKTIHFTLQSALSITGHVYETGTSIGIQNARIKISSIDINYREQTTTDDNGFFQINTVPDGLDYAFEITHEKYADLLQSKKSAGSDMTFYLEKGGSITGTIIDENAMPYANALVKVLSQSLNIIKDTTSDSNGQYEVNGLIAYKNDILVNDYWVTIEVSGYPEQYQGQKSTGDVVNFQLSRNESNQITGTVRDFMGHLLPENGITVKVKVYKDGTYMTSVKVAKDGTGIFVIEGLETGQLYQLKIGPTSSSHMPTEWVGPDHKGVLDKSDAASVETGQAIYFNFSKGIW